MGLVITDEQHRFGVNQRAALGQKAENPHMLVLSATPIPRTLALIIYGDLDVSVMNELPPGRQKVDTFAVGESYRQRVNQFIRKQVEAGHQVFIVCPLVGQEDHIPDERKAAAAYAKKLREEVFPDLRVCLLHGKMKAKEKEKVMEDFAAGSGDILVATTVVEVGVDVPNATCMVVENAERFGLSQLHQLRGRVGRGQAKSYCILLSEHPSEETKRRLKVMTKTNDGFEISREDLALRGPGDFFGQRQHGLPALKIADLSCDMALLDEAQQAAKGWSEPSPATTAPASSADTAAPASSAETAAPAASAGTLMPAASAGTAMPASSADTLSALIITGLKDVAVRTPAARIAISLFLFIIFNFPFSVFYLSERILTSFL